jgi:hypothetical protein
MIGKLLGPAQGIIGGAFLAAFVSIGAAQPVMAAAGVKVMSRWVV